MEKLFKFDNDTALVETTCGKVKGYFYNNMYMFKGIPYAKAKRFHRPEPVDKWDGIFDATNYGYVCPLLDSKSRPQGELMVPHRFWIMNEDCQNLNIWTQGLDDKKRPVMVWLHGGGFEAGSAIEQIAYEGENMCTYGDVVVVSINHRLNILGYMDFSAFGDEYENSGNSGTDDIIAALKWIKENIQKFGGDPSNVCVFGQSGGGAKVTTLLQTPEADGLFAKGINMSGVIGHLDDRTGSGEEMGKALMKECNVSTINELEEVPYDTLAAAYVKLRPILAQKGFNVGGTPYKNKFYYGNPLSNGFREESINVPLMVGSVFGEFASFAPNRFPRNTMTREEGWAACTQILGKEAVNELKPLFEEAYPDRTPVDMLNLDYIFREPEIEYNRKRAEQGGTVYSYLFDTDMILEGGKTPWHCSDIPYFFKNSELCPYSQIVGVSDKLEAEIFERVMAFAHTGNPNCEGHEEWPASTPEKEYVLQFKPNAKVIINNDHKLIPVFARYMADVVKKMTENTQIQH